MVTWARPFHQHDHFRPIRPTHSGTTQGRCNRTALTTALPLWTGPGVSPPSSCASVSIVGIDNVSYQSPSDSRVGHSRVQGQEQISIPYRQYPPRSSCMRIFKPHKSHPHQPRSESTCWAPGISQTPLFPSQMGPPVAWSNVSRLPLSRRHPALSWMEFWKLKFS